MRAIRWISAILVVLAAVGPLAAQEQIFVDLTAVGWNGDSTDPAHTDWIEAVALSGSAYRQVAYAPGQPNPGISQATFDDLSILKAVDRVSPLIQNRFTAIPDMAIEVCRTTTQQECYLRIALQDAFIIDVSAVENTCLDPAACEPDHAESVSFRFSRIEWTYTYFDGKGGSQPFSYCWDLNTGPC